jgi:predicted nucleic acid-binding protein
MTTKLTLSVDPAIISRAKRYAKRQGVSVSKLVEIYLASVSEQPAETGLPPLYLISRQLKEPDAKQALATLLKLFAVAPVDGSVLQRAMQSSGADFEDSVTAAAAQASGCHLIVTRDPKGFRRAALPALTPAQALALLR